VKVFVLCQATESSSWLALIGICTIQLTFRGLKIDHSRSSSQTPSIGSISSSTVSEALGHELNQSSLTPYLEPVIFPDQESLLFACILFSFSFLTRNTLIPLTRFSELADRNIHYIMWNHIHPHLTINLMPRSISSQSMSYFITHTNNFCGVTENSRQRLIYYRVILMLLSFYIKKTTT
jgi:hypothetical protein